MTIVGLPGSQTHKMKMLGLRERKNYFYPVRCRLKVQIIGPMDDKRAIVSQNQQVGLCVQSAWHPQERRVQLHVRNQHIAKTLTRLCRYQGSSREHLRTKVTPDFHLTYSKNGGNLGSKSK